MADWSIQEVELIVAEYFQMLAKELKGEAYSKTFHRSALKKLLPNRSEGSIEFKHQNISAVLIQLGLPYINGYKPRYNIQQLLAKTVLNHTVENKRSLEPLFESFSTTHVKEIPVDYSSILKPPPERSKTVAEPTVKYDRKPFKGNYLEREQNNSLLGTSGEQLVIEYEKWRLQKEGKDNLANQIEWVSKYDDGAGFDILSRNSNGTDRLIEVKSTKLGKETPFFFSKNEYETSINKRENYFLYRVFNFQDHPKLFNLQGSFDDFCSKQPILYKGSF